MEFEKGSRQRAGRRKTLRERRVLSGAEIVSLTLPRTFATVLAYGAAQPMPRDAQGRGGDAVVSEKGKPGGQKW